MSKYEKLDCAIVEMLSQKPTTIFDIWLKFRDQVKDISVLDRRMQHLKKKGLVVNILGKGWVKL